MSVTESKVRKGLLKIAEVDHSCQPTAVSIVPENTGGESGDELELLCGDKIKEDDTDNELKANLQITAIQDFTNPAGLVAQSWKENNTEVDFTWQPTENVADTWTGKVKVQAITVGGEVGKRLTSDVTWEITELTLPQALGGTQVIPEPSAPAPFQATA